MKKKLTKIKEIVSDGIIAQKGYINADFLKAFENQMGSGFISILNQIKITKKESDKKELFQVVSSIILKHLKQMNTEKLNLLFYGRNMEASRILVNILIPNPIHQNQISSLRHKILQQIKSNKVIDNDEYVILCQIYELLIFKDDSFPNIQSQQYQELSLQLRQQIKKKLTSLKKLMGNQSHMDQEDKKDKKKAYSENLMIRDIIGQCLQSFEDPILQKKAQQLLNCPKNKKWFGVRLDKLLRQLKWKQSEMLMLAQQIKSIKNKHKMGNIKVHQIKSKLRRIQQNLMISKQEDPESQSSSEQDNFGIQNKQHINQSLCFHQQYSHMQKQQQQENYQSHSLCQVQYNVNQAIIEDQQPNRNTLFDDLANQEYDI